MVQIVFDGLHRNDDPGLDPRRLAVSNAIDPPVRRRRRRKPGLAEWVGIIIFATMVWAALVVLA